MAIDEKHHKRVLARLVAGREVGRDAAAAAIGWLGADATVVDTVSGGVRLRVPVLPRHATDLRGPRGARS